MKGKEGPRKRTGGNLGRREREKGECEKVMKGWEVGMRGKRR